EPEERGEQPPPAFRQRDVHQSVTTCCGCRKRENATVSSATTPIRKSASTEPVSQSGKPVPNRSTIWLPYMYPLAPPTSDGVTNSPSVGTKTKKKAAITPGMESGSVTLRNERSRLAPRSLAASSKRRSRVSSETKIGSATNGSQM